MSITNKHFSEVNVTLFVDSEAQPVPEVYHVFLHGTDTAFVPTVGATIHQAWEQVLEHVAYRRSVVRNDRDSALDANDLAVIYAGSLAPGSLDALRIKHLREHLLQQLHRIAGSRSANGSGQVAAMALLAKLYGVKPLRKSASVAPTPELTTRLSEQP